MHPHRCARVGIVSNLRTRSFLKRLIITGLIPGLAFTGNPGFANPRGGSIVHGDVNIGAGNGGNLQIRQNSNSAIINWESFSIDAGELTQFRQPNRNSAVLNRVTGGDPSAIHGALKANGNVFVINPNGILVGAGGTIDVHGLVLSTLDVENGEFLAGGDLTFKGVGENVTNMGRINGIGGDVFLIGRTVRNSGTITASSGTVGLAAGEEVLLTAQGNTGERLFVRAKGAGVSGTGILNDGTIEGAAVELKAHGNMFALAINNKGSIRATGAVNSGGKVYLRGIGGSVNNSGSIRATGPGVGSGGRIAIEAAYAKVDGMMRAERGNVRITGTETVELGGTVDVSTATGKGGEVVVEGKEIEIGSTALIDASGEIGGGYVRVGGGFQGRDAEVMNAERVIIDDGAMLRADAVSSGKGGNLIVWSDGDTVFEGSVSATGISGGGFAEISGKNTLEVTGSVDLSASEGGAGTLLLDPTNITISATGAAGLGGSTISNVWLSQQLDAGTNVVISTVSGGADAGHITVGRTDTTANAAADRVQWYQNNSLTQGGTLSLLAQGDIRFNTSVQSAGRGGINVVAGWDPGSGLTMGNFDMSVVLASMNDLNTQNDMAGLGGGSVYLGAVNSRIGVNVGSRWGDTNVAGRDLILRGSTTTSHGWAQLGFADNGVEYQLSRSQNGVVLNEWWGAAAGNVQAKNYIALLGGTEFGTGDTGSLGTRAFRGAGWGATGNLAAAMSGRVDARGGTTASYTQIGHGGTLRDGSEDKWLTGQAARTTRDGIQIDPGQNRYSVFASTWRTNYAGNAARIDGDISVTAGEDILMLGNRGFVDATDDQAVNVDDGIYTMIGHGGVENQGSYHGDISVIARGVTAAPTVLQNNGLAGLGIQLLGGRGTRDFAMIGHGSGFEGNSRTVWDQSRSGNITVDATIGAIRLQAHNQALRIGDLNTGTIIGAGTPTPQNNASDAPNQGSFVQIGHGGQNSSIPASGAGNFIMPGGTNVNNIVPDGSMAGDITVTAGGTYVDATNANTDIGLLIRAGNRRWQHAMIGHGGTGHNAVNTAAQTPVFGGAANLPFGTPSLAASTGYNGKVHVEADKGSIIATGGDSFRADRSWGFGYNFARVGHGGDTVRGNKGGTITVLAGQGSGATAGDIRFTSGRMQRDHSHLGHGGYDSSGSILGDVNSAEIIVTARGDISFVSPESGDKDALGLSADYAYWWFSNASPSGTPQTASLTYWDTANRWTMVGHGGRSSITVMPNRQDITMTSGTGDDRNADGDATTGGVTFVAGDMEQDFAQLGHGGYAAGANDVNGFTGDITVNALGGGLRFDGSILGAQGVRRATDRSINGSTNTITTVGSGGGTDAYVQLGHGGYTTRGVNVGNIVINAWGGVDFLAAAAAPKVDRLVTTAPIDAAIKAGTSVWVQLANLQNTAVPAASTLAYQMPELISNVVPGTLRITLSDGSVITDVVRISSDDRVSQTAEANGLYRNGVKVGDINYDSGMIRFNATTNPLVGTWNGTGASAAFQTAQGLKERAYAQLGHGGYDADGINNKANDLISNRGDITIHAGGDIRFTGGAAHRNYAQLGHGGLDTKGSSGGNITIDHIDFSDPLGRVGGLRFLAGVGGYRQYDYHSYALLGHGGNEADGNHYGNILVRGTEDADGMGLFFKAGDRQDASVQLGHGGYNVRTGTLTPTRTSYGLNGDIDIEVTGDVAFVAGTLSTTNPGNREDGRLYAQLGHGGYDADATNDSNVVFGQGRTNPLLPVGTAGAGDGSWGHFGDISLVSSNGNISFMGGSNVPITERRDLDGLLLPLPADPNGFLTGNGNGNGRIHPAQIGHGGYGSSGDHSGNISVIARNGSVNLVGGMMSNDDASEKYNYSQIGHGGAEAQGHLGRPDQTIRVHALGVNGNVLAAGGSGNRNQALIGNGGLNYDGSHSGNIEVYAGNNIYLRGGIALERVVKRIGEFQDMIGVDGGAANDLSEFNGYYGSGGLGYLPMDEAAFAGGGQKTKLIGREIQAGTVEFRLAIAAPALFNAAQTPDYVDDGNGNIVANGTTTVVGTINYATGEIAWTTGILATDTDGQPDLFVNYDHRTGIRNDALYANATIGHGGYGTGSRVETLPGGGINRGINGAIDVRAGVGASGAFNGSGGSISAVAGNDQRTYVQIGHGGMDSGTPAGHAFSGAITTKADGNIVFRGGGGLIDNHMIGFNYTGTGGTEVTAVTVASDADRLSPRYATPLAAGTRTNSGPSEINYAFAHIGHGGVSAHANNGVDNNVANPLAPGLDPATGHNGKILVETGTGDINFRGGGVTGNFHFAMIGHGGASSLGNHFGDIEVNSGGDINFNGGGASYRSGATSAEGRSFVQIGHGGLSLTGNLEGEIAVSAIGSINFAGGDALSNRQMVPYGAHVHALNFAGNQDDNHYNRTDTRQTHAMIGHGGTYVYGDKTGAIGVSAGNGINFRGGDRLEGSLDNNAGYVSFAQIGHGGYQSWRHYRANNTVPGLPATASASDDWNLPFWWDGTQYVFDGTFGPNGTGQFFWGVDNSINAAIGLGNPLNDGFSGDIAVTATGGDIRFSSGTGMGTFGRIGHGGVETGGDHNGQIDVEAVAGDILFSANRIEETGSSSTASNAFVQIGHGGGYSSGEQSGEISVSASGEITFKGGRVDSFAMIGHGGRESHGTQNGQVSGTTTYRRSTNFLLNANAIYRPGTRSGNINVTAGGDISLLGGNLNGDRAFVQIGHGGFNVHANPDPTGQFGDGHNGAIEVVSTGGSLLLQSGQATNAHAQIGHGGTQSFGNHGGDGSNNKLNSSILVQTANGVDVKASGRFSSNATPANQAQIGHGGRQSSFRDIEDIDAALYAKLQPYTGYTNPVTGVVNVDNGGLHPLTPFLNNTNSTGTEGLGLGPRATLGAFLGDITVRTTGDGADIRFMAPNEGEGTLGIVGTESYVMLGHGGYRVFGDVTGNITVDSAGALEFTGLQGTGLAPNVNSNHNLGFAQLGHGGFESGGTYAGDIDVTTRGDIRFQGAASVNGSNAGFVQLGHGGYNTWKGTGQYLEATRNPLTGVVPTALLSTGNSGNISVTSGGNLEFYAGRDNTTFAQLGHGGYVSRDSHSGNITVNVTGGIAFHGGVDFLDTDIARANPGGNDFSHAMLGHGGYDSDGTHSGNITVTAGSFGAGHAEAGQGIVFRAGAWNDNFTQLGHGGVNSKTYGAVNAEQGLSGAISATAVGDITFVGGTGNFFNSDENARLYAQLGHGGYEVDVTQDGSHVIGNGIGHSGAISVISSGGRIFFGAGDAGRTDQVSVGTGEGRFHYAQLGHGGYEARGDHSGNITVSASSDLIFLGGSSEDNDNELVNYAQLGHGGRTAVGNQGRVGELISVTAGRDIIFRAGNSQDSPAQLGNGGREARGDHSGDILLRAGRHVEFSAVQGRHLITDEEKNFDLTRATELGSQTGDVIYDLEGSNVVPGTVVITIPNGPILKDDGNGNIVVTGGDAGVLSSLGLSIGDVVANVLYTTGTGTNGRITFLTDVNPNNAASPGVALLATVSYESLEIQGSYAQLGHGGYNADQTDGGFNTLGNQGSITLFARGDVTFNGGMGAQGYSQLGHGGYLTDGRNSGNITLGSAVERIGGAVVLTGGRGEYFDAADAYAQIGHGGRSARGTQTGDISIYASSGIAPEYDGVGVQVKAGTRNNTFAQIGHGGTSSRSGTGNGAAGMEGNSGNITVDALGSVNVIAGILDQSSGTIANSNDDGNNYAQIGHGGFDADVSIDGVIANGNGIGHNGSITVISRLGSVNVLGGDHLRSVLPGFAPRAGVYDGLVNNGLARMDPVAGGRYHYAMIGHGGFEARGNHSGNITVHAGFDGAAVQTNANADSHVRVHGGRSLPDQDESAQFAQIGHGGRTSSGDLGKAGEVTSVMATGNVEVHAGDGVDGYAQIGNGGVNARGDHQGQVQVFAGQNVSVLASQLPRSATAGNGLYGQYWYNDTAVNNNRFSFDRATLVLAGDSQPAGRALIRGVNGIIPGTLSFDIYNDGGVLIGSVADTDGSGSLRVVADFSELVNGTQLAAGQVVGTANYASNYVDFTTQLNPNADGGTPNVIAKFEHVRADRAYAQIGHGGYDSDNTDGNTSLGNRGDVSVVALRGDVSVQGGYSAETSAQIGHGGRSTMGGNSGNVTVRAGRNIDFTARGEANRAYVQIGHGGYDADGDHSGDVIVSAGSGLLNTSLGLGLFDDLGDFNRDGLADAIQFDPAVAGQGSVTLTGGTFAESWVQVGHGGYLSGNTAANASTMTGQVGVAAHGSITLQGGTAAGAYAQIGHGGLENNLNMTLGGDISVVSQTGALNVSAGSGSEAYALVGHGSLRNTLTNVPSGTRSGSIYLEAAKWEITPNGTTALAYAGHRSQAANNGLNGPNQFSLIGNGADGTSTYVVNEAYINLTGVRDHLATGGGANFGAIGNLVMDLPLGYNSAGTVNMLATGDLTLLRSVQNSGSGEVNAVAGWDNLSPALDFLDRVPMRDIDITAIYADVDAWGNNGKAVVVGGGSQAAGVAVGSGGGTTTVLGDSVQVLGSNAASGGYAMIGFAGAQGVDPSGGITVASKTGGVSLLAGNPSSTYVQIGHRATGAITSNLSGAINVESGGDLTVRGGGGLLTAAHIGHGGQGATVSSLAGSIAVDVAGDITLTAGTGAVAYSQIGHGGSNTAGAMSGDVIVTAGGDVSITSTNTANFSYGKIGHGDDIRGNAALLGGTGTRSGNIEVAAGSDIRLSGAMIGHINSLTAATALSGVTQIGVSRDNPTDPSGGDLVADAGSQFQGADEFRFYLPRRGNNQIAAGAILNGAVWQGASTDPAPVQRIDEYTINIIGNPSSTPNEHGNVFGTGPAPATAAGYAFYYDTIFSGPAPIVVTPPIPGGPIVSPEPQPPLPPVTPTPDFPSFIPDDRTTDDWQREQEGIYSGPGEVNFYYEGFDQYGYFGESIFSVGQGNSLDGGMEVDEEEILRRHLRLLGIEG